MAVSAEQASVGHRLDIQGLRAVAVLLVIADHAGLRWLPGGFVGVDVFFVISGYLITRLLVREAAATGRVRIGQFYARRARRILPAATVVILVTTAYAVRELSLTRVRQVRDDALWSAMFAANVHLARLRTDYFQQSREPSPFQHFWSLAVEEQFYLVWPPLVAVCLVIVGRRGGSATRARDLTTLLAIVITVSCGWSILRTAAAPGIAYYSSPARAWELAVGALVAVQQQRWASLGLRSRRVLVAGGLAAIGVAAAVYDAGSALPGWRALPPVLGAAAIVAAGVGDARAASHVLTAPPLPWLGDLSYSLYLWHWPVLVLGPGQAEVFEGPRGTGLLLGVTLAAAVASYHLVETPLRRSRLLGRGRRSLALWPVALGAVALGVVLAEQHAAALLADRMAGPPPQAGPEATPQRPDRDPGPKPRAVPAEPALVDRLAEALRLAASGAPVPFPLTNLPGVSEGVWPSRCAADGPETSTPVCRLGQPDAKRAIVVFGDSQAAEWLPAIDRLGRSEGFRVLPLIKYGCSPYDVPMVDGAGAEFWQCSAFRTWAAEYVAEANPSLVMVGSEAFPDGMYDAPGLDHGQTWASGVSSLLHRMRRQGTAVIVLADTPNLAFDPVDCLTDPDASLASCVGTPHEGLSAANAATHELARDAGAAYLDTVSLVCVRDRCPIVVDRTVTFWDAGHVSPAWSAELADDFTRLYRAALTALDDGSAVALRSMAANQLRRIRPLGPRMMSQ